MLKKTTNNGKKGGMLKGKPHYDKQGNSVGGIKAVVTDAGGKPVELEGGEVIINKEASKKYWRELSKINQSAGNGVAIGPPAGMVDEDPSEEYGDGGKIEFNANKLPNKWILGYAKKIKRDHPEIWKLGGNIFGNEAFNNLSRVAERGYWLDSEEWMYKKWQSYVARHHKDFRIEGVVAMLKWVDKVDKGWPYMKQLIEDKIEKLSKKGKGWKHKEAAKMKSGGNLIKRADGTYSKRGLWDNIRDNIGSGKKPTKQMLEQEAEIKDETKYHLGGDMSKHLAPNGKQSNLTHEQWHLVRTPEFKKWFGDWENSPETSSKVVDENGEPLVMYHGSPYNFTTFETNEIESDVNDRDFKSRFWFIADKNWADNYSTSRSTSTQKTYEVFLNIRNPKYDFNLYADEENDGSIEVRNKKIWVAIATLSNQIKLADGTNVKFDSNNSDIRYEQGGLIAPNGKKSNLTPEQYKLVRTPAFKSWFGDWEHSPETASKVVDENGEPLVVYHGSKSSFNSFDKSKLGLTDKGWYGKGFYFSPTTKIPSYYGEVKEYFLNIRKPLDVNKQNPLYLQPIEVTDEYIKKGYDGASSTLDLDKMRHEYCVFYEFPNNIKLADGTNVTFDSNNPDIRYEQGGLIAPNGKQSNLTPEQYKLVRTPQFKSWFGDWERDPKNSSKVIDENGEPLVVYRGDSAQSKKGSIFKTGFNRMGFVSKNRLPNAYFHYFVNNYDVAMGYAENQIEDHNDKVQYTGKGKKWDPKVTPYFLNIRNPMDITPNNPLFPSYKEYTEILKHQFGEDYETEQGYSTGWKYGFGITSSALNKIFIDKLGKDYLNANQWYRVDDWAKEGFEKGYWDENVYSFFIEYDYSRDRSAILNNVYNSMKNQGVDGMVFLESTHWKDKGDFFGEYNKYSRGEIKNEPKFDYKRWVEKPKVFAALESNQIKLADGSNTTFDGSNPDIRYKDGGELKMNITLQLKKVEDIFYVTAEKNGVKVGKLTFVKSKYKPNLIGTSVEVNPNYQRQGIATAMYKFAENELQLKFVRNENVLTPDGKLLWDSFNKKQFSHGGELAMGIKAEHEHSQTIGQFKKPGVSDLQVETAIAKDHLKEDPHYYSKLQNMEAKKYDGGGLITNEGIEAKIGDTGKLSTKKGLIDIKITNITEKWVIFNDLSDGGKRKDNPIDKFKENYKGSGTQTAQPAAVTTTTQPAKGPIKTEPVTVRNLEDLEGKYLLANNKLYKIKNASENPKNLKVYLFLEIVESLVTWEIGKEVEPPFTREEVANIMSGNDPNNKLLQEKTTQPATPSPVKKPMLQNLSSVLVSSTDELEGKYLINAATQTVYFIDKYYMDKNTSDSERNYLAVTIGVSPDKNLIGTTDVLKFTDSEIKQIMGQFSADWVLTKKISGEATKETSQQEPQIETVEIEPIQQAKPVAPKPEKFNPNLDYAALFNGYLQSNTESYIDVTSDLVNRQISVFKTIISQ